MDGSKFYIIPFDRSGDGWDHLLSISSIGLGFSRNVKMKNYLRLHVIRLIVCNHSMVYRGSIANELGTTGLGVVFNVLQDTKFLLGRSA